MFPRDLRLSHTVLEILSRAPDKPGELHERHRMILQALPSFHEDPTEQQTRKHREIRDFAHARHIAAGWMARIPMQAAQWKLPSPARGKERLLLLIEDIAGLIPSADEKDWSRSALKRLKERKDRLSFLWPHGIPALRTELEDFSTAARSYGKPSHGARIPVQDPFS